MRRSLPDTDDAAFPVIIVRPCVNHEEGHAVLDGDGVLSLVMRPGIRFGNRKRIVQSRRADFQGQPVVLPVFRVLLWIPRPPQDDLP